MPNKHAEYQEAQIIHAEVRFGGERPPGPPLQPPGGGGPFDGMEPRVARLEADVGHIKDDSIEMKQSLRSLLTSVSTGQVDFARLDERVRHLPSKGFIVAAVLTALTAIGAITLFQANLQRALNISVPSPLAHPAPPPE